MVVTRDERFWPSGGMRRLHVYLPDEYWDSEERYPVMYFLDGARVLSEHEDAEATRAPVAPEAPGASPSAIPAGGIAAPAGAATPTSTGAGKAGATTKPEAGTAATKAAEKAPVPAARPAAAGDGTPDPDEEPGWHLERFLDAWGKRMVVVAVEASDEPGERRRELSPWHGGAPSGPSPDAPAPGAADGGRTVEWLMRDVKPLVDAKLRTWPHREATGIAGAGAAGMLALYAALHHNDVFSKAACLSCDLRHDGHLAGHELAASEIDPDTRIFLSWGERELAAASPSGHAVRDSAETRAATKLSHRLTARGASTYVVIQPRGGADEASWGALAPSFMGFLWLDQRI